MNCPNCKTTCTPESIRCDQCNYGLATAPKPKVSRPRHLGDTGKETRDEELARTFRCGNCRSIGGHVKRVAMTGAGFSRLLDYQNNEFIVVSCKYCGTVQMYDPKVVDSVSSGWPLLDLLT